MNVTQMLTGYANNTIKPKIIRPPEVKEPRVCDDETRKTLDRGRATRTANANKRRARLAKMILSGATVSDAIKRLRICSTTLGRDVKIIRGSMVSETMADVFLETAPKRIPPKNGHRKETVEKTERILDRIRKKPCTVYELAEEFCMTRESMIGYTIRLQDAGKITRTEYRPYKFVAVKRSKGK